MKLFRFIKIFAREFWESIPFDSDTKTFFGISLIGAFMGAILAIGQHRQWDLVAAYSLLGSLFVWLALAICASAFAAMLLIVLLFLQAWRAAKAAWAACGR